MYYVNIFIAKALYTYHTQVLTDGALYMSKIFNLIFSLDLV